MRRGYLSKLLLCLCFAGSFSGCATPANQSRQIADVCQAADLATPVLAVASLSDRDREAIDSARATLAPICADPAAQYSDVMLSAALVASATLVRYAKQ